MKNLFEGLGELGFETVDDMDTFKTVENSKETQVNITSDIAAVSDCVFEKSWTCPVCGVRFKNVAPKTSKLRFEKVDIDLMPSYTPLYPFFYNIVICPGCGYAALMENFMRITESQSQLIMSEISPKYRNKDYPTPLTEDMAIERYKFALLNAVIKRSRASEKGYLCLVISWLYKLKGDEENRLLFTKNAYDALVAAYTKDTFPIYGMNEIVTAYLIAELARYLGDTDESRKWLGKVMGSRMATQKVKDMALELKQRLAKAPAHTQQ